MKKYIAYYRVSTDRQGKSGLGLDAQRNTVSAYLNGGQWEILEEYTEVESGKRNDRPKLIEALASCKKHKATLIIAKLDRLARNVHFISGLLESGVDFVAVDNPSANKLMMHMLAAFAEHERDVISQRTKDALAVAKTRGIKLGSPSPSCGALAMRNKSLLFNKDIAEIVAAMHSSGSTLSSICNYLNNNNIKPMRGPKWYPTSVRNVLLSVQTVQQPP